MVYVFSWVVLSEDGDIMISSVEFVDFVEDITVEVDIRDQIPRTDAGKFRAVVSNVSK